MGAQGRLGAGAFLPGERLEAQTGRADAARDERAATGDLDREPDPRPVDLVGLVGEPVSRETIGVRAERIGRQHPGPGLQVLLMNLPHELGLRQVHGLETVGEEHAPLVEQAAHGTVEEQPAAPGELKEVFHGARRI